LSDQAANGIETPTSIDERFSGLESFKLWLAGATWRRPTAIEAIAARMCANGFVEPLTRRPVPPGLVRPGGDVREGLAFQGICSRVRAVMRAIEEEVEGRPRLSVRIYAPEAVTALALRMRGIFPKFIGSEYTPDPGLARDMFPILLEDLCRLSFPDDVFDIVSTNEVLEHVPDLDTALSEIHRVLKPGGVHIGTHPFLFMSEQSQIRARLIDGKIELLMEPEIHGDPFGRQGSLVFELPAWDIIGRCIKAGFAQAEMRLMMSEEYGYMAGGIGGVFVLYARKQVKSGI